jgi:hypothetical protein
MDNVQSCDSYVNILRHNLINLTCLIFELYFHNILGNLFLSQLYRFHSRMRDVLVCSFNSMTALQFCFENTVSLYACKVGMI